MISKQETFNLSPYIALYDLIIPKDNMFRQISRVIWHGNSEVPQQDSQ